MGHQQQLFARDPAPDRDDLEGPKFIKDFIGLQGGKVVSFSLGDLFARRASLFTTSLRDRPTAEKARIVRGVVADIWPLIEAKKVRPVIDRVFSLEEAALAHEYMETGRHAGKILLTVGENEHSIMGTPK